MAESKSDNPRDIIDKYLKKSLAILNRTDDDKIKLRIYFDIAKFADAEYKQVFIIYIILITRTITVAEVNKFRNIFTF